MIYSMIYLMIYLIKKEYMYIRKQQTNVKSICLIITTGPEPGKTHVNC